MKVNHVQLIFVDGANGWNVTETHTVQVNGEEFNTDLCCDVLNSIKHWNVPDLEYVTGHVPLVDGNIVTCVDEGSCYVFVGY